MAGQLGVANTAGEGGPAMNETDGRLASLALLLEQRNSLDVHLAGLVGRPAFPQHIAEFVAALVFDLELNESASAKGDDGKFRSGPLAGKTVNVKYISSDQGTLDLQPDGSPDCYMVLAGPRESAGSSREQLRPFVVASVYLFDHSPLVADLQGRGVKVGTASSIRRTLWDRALIYGFPEPATGGRLALTDEQVGYLRRFGPDNFPYGKNDD